MGIVQLSYMAYVSLAVQRAALAIAQDASLTGDRAVRNFRSKLNYSLAPLISLSPKTLASISACQCACRESFDKKNITVQIRYPMPIWVPLMGRIFGESLAPHFDSHFSKGGSDLQMASKFFGIPTPDFSLHGLRIPFYCWITFNASAHNEGYVD
jgi:hypothetical protein